MFVSRGTALAVLAIALDQNIVAEDHLREDIIKLEINNKIRIANKKLLKTIFIHMPYNFTDVGNNVVISELASIIKKEPNIITNFIEVNEIIDLIFTLSITITEPVLAFLQEVIVKKLIISKAQFVFTLLNPQCHSIKLLIPIADYSISNF